MLVCCDVVVRSEELVRLADKDEENWPVRRIGLVRGNFMLLYLKGARGLGNEVGMSSKGGLLSEQRTFDERVGL